MVTTHPIPGESVMEIFTDSDWASDRTSRRSVSCATIFLGGCLLYSCSRTQNWSPFQVLKQKCMRVPVALQMVSSCAGLLNG